MSGIKKVGVVLGDYDGCFHHLMISNESHPKENINQVIASGAAVSRAVSAARAAEIVACEAWLKKRFAGYDKVVFMIASDRQTAELDDLNHAGDLDHGVEGKLNGYALLQFADYVAKRNLHRETGDPVFEFFPCSAHDVRTGEEPGTYLSPAKKGWSCEEALGENKVDLIHYLLQGVSRKYLASDVQIDAVFLDDYAKPALTGHGDELRKKCTHEELKILGVSSFETLKFDPFVTIQSAGSNFAVVPAAGPTPMVAKIEASGVLRPPGVGAGSGSAGSGESSSDDDTSVGAGAGAGAGAGSSLSHASRGLTRSHSDDSKKYLAAVEYCRSYLEENFAKCEQYQETGWQTVFDLFLLLSNASNETERSAALLNLHPLMLLRNTPDACTESVMTFAREFTEKFKGRIPASSDAFRLALTRAPRHRDSGTFYGELPALGDASTS